MFCYSATSTTTSSSTRGTCAPLHGRYPGYRVHVHVSRQTYFGRKTVSWCTTLQRYLHCSEGAAGSKERAKNACTSCSKCCTGRGAVFHPTALPSLQRGCGGEPGEARSAQKMLAQVAVLSVAPAAGDRRPVGILSRDRPLTVSVVTGTFHSLHVATGIRDHQLHRVPGRNSFPGY
eukprot:2455472-Rhodomonas_salina.3